MAYEISDHGLGRDTMTNAKAKKPEAEDLGWVRLIRMRRLANGLLVVIMAVFVFSHIWEPPGQEWDMHWRFVRAFAEAAMVGGLADWFAVTALFNVALRDAKFALPLLMLAALAWAAQSPAQHGQADREREGLVPGHRRSDQRVEPDAPLRNHRRTGRADSLLCFRRVVLHHRLGAAGRRRRPGLNNTRRHTT